MALFLCVGVSAQVVNIPDKAKNDFAKKYINATDVKWENKGSYYLCHFKDIGVASTAHYHMDGTWDFTEKELKEADMPAAVKDSFSKSAYRDWQVKYTAYVENTKGERLFRYELRKGAEKKFVFFDKDGKLIKTNASI